MFRSLDLAPIYTAFRAAMLGLLVGGAISLIAFWLM